MKAEAAASAAPVAAAPASSLECSSRQPEVVETELESTIEAREALLARVKTMADGLAKLPKATAEAGLQAAALEFQVVSWTPLYL